MTPRKPLRKAQNARTGPRLPLPAVRRQIWDAARDLVAAGDTREVSAVLANRYRLPEAVIDAVLIHEGIRHERVAATLRQGIVNALDLANEASSEDEAAA